MVEELLFHLHLCIKNNIFSPSCFQVRKEKDLSTFLFCFYICKTTPHPLSHVSCASQPLLHVGWLRRLSCMVALAAVSNPEF